MSLRYVVKEGVSGFRRARLASITSITALVIATLLSGMMVRFGYSAYQVVQTLKQSINVEVFLMDVSNQRRDLIARDLQAYEVVTDVEFISREQAAEVFRSEFGTGADGLGDALADLDFLPASFRLTLDAGVSASYIRDMITEVERFQGVDEVVFNQQLLETLEERMEWLAVLAAVIGFSILFTAVVLVFNTIRLTIYAKRELIRAMKLVGATNRFIRRPFLLEGFLQGLVAAVVACGMHWALFQFVLPHYIPQLGVMAWPLGHWYYLTGGMAALSLIMGLSGSRWASRRFISDSTVS